jgi:hypothetical protein
MISLLVAMFALSTAAVAVEHEKSQWSTRTYNPATTQVGNIPWTTSNLETLRGFDKKAIVRFFNESGALDTWPGTGINPSYIREFSWIDLAGDSKLELVTIESSGPCCVALGIDRQDTVGKASSIGFAGATTIKKTVRDLNGDGKYELILYSYLDSDGYNGTTPVAMWPQVYRLENGTYVPASRDFQRFYDDEVLPQLNSRIKVEEARHWPPDSAAARNIEILQMEQDKIVRVLGRDPTAGLELAREWMTSRNPETVRRASIVFADMGYQDEHRAAVAAYKLALSRQPRPGSP